MSFTDLPPGAKIVSGAPASGRFSDLPPGAKVVGAPQAKAQESSLPVKILGAGINVERVLGALRDQVVGGIAGLPKAFITSQPDPRKPPTDQAIQSAANTALLAVGKSPAAGTGSDIASAAGVGARSGEADAAGQAAVEGAIGPEPVNPDTTRANAAGVDAVQHALSPQPPPDSFRGPWGAVPPGPARTVPSVGARPAVPAPGPQGAAPPPAVASALNQALGPAGAVPGAIDVEAGAQAFAAAKKAQGFSPSEVADLTADYRRAVTEFNARLNDNAAIPSEANPPAPIDPVLQQGQDAVEKALKAPGWISPNQPRPPPISTMREIAAEEGQAAVAQALKNPGWIGRNQPTPPPIERPPVGPPTYSTFKAPQAPADVSGTGIAGRSTPASSAPVATAPAASTPALDISQLPIEEQATLASLLRDLPALHSVLRAAINPLNPRNAIRLITHSPTIMRWFRGVGQARGSRTRLRPFAASIDRLAKGDKSTRDLLQRAIVAANASGPVSPGQ